MRWCIETLTQWTFDQYFKQSQRESDYIIMYVGRMKELGKIKTNSNEMQDVVFSCFL